MLNPALLQLMGGGQNSGGQGLQDPNAVDPHLQQFSNSGPSPAPIPWAAMAGGQGQQAMGGGNVPPSGGTTPGSNAGGPGAYDPNSGIAPLAALPGISASPGSADPNISAHQLEAVMPHLMHIFRLGLHHYFSPQG